MKKIFIFIFLMCSLTLTAQKIHWITFIDTDDERVGEIDVLGREVLYSNFINEVNGALSPIGYKSAVYDFYGSKVTPENCKRIVEEIRVEPDDILMFYYIGHGGRPITNDPNYMKTHPFPQMCMSQWDEKKFIPLEWVGDLLSKKGARLSVTIGMCCNDLSNISIKSAPNFSPNYGSSYMSGNKMNKIQELFLNSKGSVLATSASPAQTSGCFRSDFGIIDAYTTVLCQIFKNSLDTYSGPLTWNNLLGTIAEEINKETEGKQSPFHRASLTAATAPAAKTPETPSSREIEATQKEQTAQSSKSSGEGDEWVNQLSGYFSTLINTNVPEEKRIELEEILGELFANNAQVKVLAQDSNLVVDKESAEAFLGRLATSRLLLNVAVVDGSFDSDSKITTLNVREVYRK